MNYYIVLLDSNFDIVDILKYDDREVRDDYAKDTLTDNSWVFTYPKVRYVRTFDGIK